MRHFFCSFNSCSSYFGLLQTYETHGLLKPLFLLFLLSNMLSPHISSCLIQTSQILPPDDLSLSSISPITPFSYQVLFFLDNTYHSLNLSYPSSYILEYKLYENWNFVSPIYGFHPQDWAYRKHAMYKRWINAFTCYSYTRRI